VAKQDAFRCIQPALQQKKAPVVFETAGAFMLLKATEL
jgi:hypothetical protein